MKFNKPIHIYSSLFLFCWDAIRFLHKYKHWWLLQVLWIRLAAQDMPMGLMHRYAPLNWPPTWKFEWMVVHHCVGLVVDERPPQGVQKLARIGFSFIETLTDNGWVNRWMNILMDRWMDRYDWQNPWVADAQLVLFMQLNFCYGISRLLS